MLRSHVSVWCGGYLAFRIKQRNGEWSGSVVQLIVRSAWLAQGVSWSISLLLYLKRPSLFFFFFSYVEMDILAPGRDSSLLASFMRAFWFWWQRLLFSFCLVIQVISSKMIQKSVAFQPLLNVDFLLLIYMLVLVEIWRLTQIFLRSECLKMFAIWIVNRCFTFWFYSLEKAFHVCILLVFSIHLLLPLSEEYQADPPELPWVMLVAHSRDKLTFLMEGKKTG